MNEPLRVKRIAGAVSAALLVSQYGMSNAAQSESKEGTGFAGFNFKFAVGGQGASAPTQVFDDGHRTYFQFSNLKRVPSITAYDSNGISAAISYQIESPYVVVEGITPRYELALDSSRATVSNDGYQAPRAQAEHAPSTASVCAEERRVAAQDGRAVLKAPSPHSSSAADLLGQAQDLYYQAVAQNQSEAQELLLRAMRLLQADPSEHSRHLRNGALVRVNTEPSKRVEERAFAPRSGQAATPITSAFYAFDGMAESPEMLVNPQPDGALSGMLRRDAAHKSAIKPNAPTPRLDDGKASKRALTPPLGASGQRPLPAGPAAHKKRSTSGKVQLAEAERTIPATVADVTPAPSAFSARTARISQEAAPVVESRAAAAVPMSDYSSAEVMSRGIAERPEVTSTGAMQNRSSSYSTSSGADDGKPATHGRAFVLTVKENQKLSDALREFLKANGWNMQWDSGSDFVVRRGYSVQGSSVEDVLLSALTDYQLSAVLYKGNMVAAISGGDPMKR